MPPPHNVHAQLISGDRCLAVGVNLFTSIHTLSVLTGKVSAICADAQACLCIRWSPV